MQDVISLRLGVKGFYAVIDSGRGETVSRGKNLITTVTADKKGILLGKTASNTDKIQIKAEARDAIAINGRRFHGDIQFIKDKNNRLLAINYLELEDYINGIAVREISHYWPVEALKAMTIVFRTFAVYKMQENAKQEFDLTSDVYSQVYSGKSAERYRINKAGEETKGIVLTYQEKILPAFYHSTCGGYTEDASMLWNIDLAPLKGVPCNFCKNSPHFSWHAVLSLQDIEKNLSEGGCQISNIKDILILGRDNSGRITELKILCAKKERKISAKDFRNLIGPDIIRSTNFSLNIVERDAVFEGYGWGHGAGLCQWGAYFMAKLGYKAQEILKFYYPQAELSSR